MKLPDEYVGRRFLTGKLQDQLDRYYGYSPDDFSNRYRHRQRVDFIRRWLEDYITPDKTRVLEIGCGCGVYSILSTKLRAKTTATDIDLSYQKTVRLWSSEEGLEHLIFAACPAGSLPFQDGEFDIVIMSAVLDYLPDAAKAVKEISRVLRPGGYFLISQENALSARAFLLRFMMHPQLRSWRGLDPMPPITYRRVTAWPYWRTRQLCLTNEFQITRQGCANILPTYNFKLLKRIWQRFPEFVDAWEHINTCFSEVWPFRLVGSHYFVLARKPHRQQPMEIAKGQND